ncbi:MAG TPA: rhodanese-like domain-containing protein [Lactobacillus sp.]|uniref:Rhodanese-like domain protein n=1 Tax=Secundilactobacillus silagincola TaxID=1714681 RepID=A0A1Z5J215_9LACO|nr:rhodanese-like domain-containing protein [Secundilactobacillus silagincola]GAX07761.1 rhodanese-like domain protein [Secundilactobacillus silagincola]HBF74951.1 rhodanese-like domain-containing protein [Lactobacillus sp.]
MVIAAISTSQLYTIILVVLLIAYLLWYLYGIYQRNQAATLIDEKTFREGMRKAQVIDVREKKDFDAGHILGARNIPYSTMRAYYQGIRKDLPVYLYDQGKAMSSRSAVLLKKHGYKDIYILKTGYARWDGKTKKS